MLSVEQAIEQVRQRCRRDWVVWALGRGSWPLRLNLGTPRGVEFDRNTTPAQLWAASWAAARNDGLPGQIDTAARRARGLGTHDLPTHWEVSGPLEALSLEPDLAAKYEQARARFAAIVDLPEVVWESVESINLKTAKAIAALNDADWFNATTTVTHIAAGPGDARILRQLAVPGVHTKWIEDNATLLCAMLGVPPGPDDSRKRLEAHIGLMADQAPVDIYLACPRLRSAAAGLERFSASVPTLNASSLAPQSVLIIENHKLGRSLNFQIEGLAVIYGLGSGVTRLVGLDWLKQTRTVLYWGDLDRAGLAILASLRRAGAPAHAVLMDEKTWDLYPQLQHESVRVQRLSDIEVPGGLEAPERALYERLNEEYRRRGKELQLEQEHIPVSDAIAAILPMLI